MLRFLLFRLVLLKRSRGRVLLERNTAFTSSLSSSSPSSRREAVAAAVVVFTLELVLARAISCLLAFHATIDPHSEHILSRSRLGLCDNTHRTALNNAQHAYNLPISSVEMYNTSLTLNPTSLAVQRTPGTPTTQLDFHTLFVLAERTVEHLVQLLRLLPNTPPMYSLAFTSTHLSRLKVPSLQTN